MKLSVVVPTKNEAKNIGACLGAFRCSAFEGAIECIVVDNNSDDGTCDIARSLGARVFLQGPERCAQRNRGWREARGDWVLFLDADMIMPKETIEEALCACEKRDVDAWYIPERRSGHGLRALARDFERSFYNGTCIDGLRLIRRSALKNVGGYDETLIACEDWDLDRRLLDSGVRTAVFGNHLVHNEAQVTLGRFLAKKAYYSESVGRYRAKWGEDATVRMQFGLAYRFFGVFVEKGKWRKVLRHPVLFAVMMFERVAVGVVYLLNRGR